MYYSVASAEKKMYHLSKGQLYFHFNCHENGSLCQKSSYISIKSSKEIWFVWGRSPIKPSFAILSTVLALTLQRFLKSSLDKNLPLLASSSIISAALSPRPSIVANDGIQLAVNDLKAVCFCTININLYKFKATGIHFLYDLHIL